MIEIYQTEVYADWFANLRDRQARARINARIRCLSLGNSSDARPVGAGVSELRIDYGSGYRICFFTMGSDVVILLAGGDRDTKNREIRTALEMVGIL